MIIQELRDARRTGAVAFLRFCQDKSRHGDCVFCFFEGEDKKYYNQRVETFSGYKYDEIVTYECGGREEVLKVYDLITAKKEYKNVNKMFFIDRDFFPIEKGKKDLYQTPCYSIENFYTSKECFSKIICNEFGINTIDTDFKKCVSDYIERQNEFHDNISELNAWYLCQRKYEEEQGVYKNNYSIPITKYIRIDIDGIHVNSKIDKKLLEELFPDAYIIDESSFKKIHEYLIMCNHQQFYRGKFELILLCKIIESIVAKNKKGTYFSTKKDNVRVNASTNTLSIFSNFADTPEDLVVFLKEHKKELS